MHPTISNRQYFTVIHAVPGRCRLRFPFLRTSTLVQRDLERRLGCFKNIDKFQINTVCSSVVITFNGDIDILFSALMEFRSQDFEEQIQTSKISLLLPSISDLKT